MSKTVVFGGSFDPIHFGHITLANSAMQFTKANHLIFMPTAISPFKVDSHPASEEHRLAMCRLACGYVKNSVAEDLEFNLPRPSYTVNTLNALKKKYNQDLVFVCGADSFMTMHKWKNPEEIFNLAEIFTAVRDDIDTERLKLQKTVLENMGAKIILSTMPPIKVSSRDIRYKIENNISTEGLLPPEIAKYIYENQLYRK